MLKNNGLSVVLFGLFALTLAGHSWSGWKVYNEDQQQHGGQTASFQEYLHTSDFGESVFENWESEFLQMGFYILLTVFLYQRGSSESKKDDESNEVDEDPAEHSKDAHAPSPVKKGGWRLALYKNSLSIAFISLFVLSFLGHAATGARKYNEEEIHHGVGKAVSTIGYLGTSQFWFESMQNWQSEFLAMFCIVVLSIWLRQWGSPESKPVHAPHSETGS